MIAVLFFRIGNYLREWVFKILIFHHPKDDMALSIKKTRAKVMTKNVRLTYTEIMKTLI